MYTHSHTGNLKYCESVRKLENPEETLAKEHAQKLHTDSNPSCEVLTLSAVPLFCPLADICNNIDQISFLLES